MRTAARLLAAVVGVLAVFGALAAIPAGCLGAAAGSATAADAAPGVSLLLVGAVALVLGVALLRWSWRGS